MREKIFNTIIIMLSFFVLIELLMQREIVYISIMEALGIWVYKLIPALFPFFIISDILINYNITNYIPKIIKDFCKHFFNINDNMLAILILSMLSGFPSNARNTRTLYDNNAIDLEEANHILIFSHFANPIFILTTVGVFFFGNKKIGLSLLIIHYLSNFILGFLVRKKNINNRCYSIKKDSDNFGNIFILAIRKAIDTILMICGIVVVFLMLSSIITHTFNLSIYNEMIVKGLMEITIGLEALSKLSLAYNYKIVIASMFLAFGGISIHVQVLSQITGTEIEYRYFFMGRMYQMVIAGILAYLYTLIMGI